MFSENLMLDAIDYALSIGAQYVEVRSQKNSEFVTVSRNGVLIGTGESVIEGIGVRVIVDGALGFSATNKIDRENIMSAVKKAVGLAKASSRFMKKPIEFSPCKLARVQYSVVSKKAFENIDLSEKLELHSDLWKTAGQVIKEVKIPVLFVLYKESVEEKVVVNSDGAYVRSITPRISILYNVVASHPTKGTVQRTQQYGASGGYEWIGEWKLHETFKDEVEKLEEILVKAVEPPREPVDVIVGSELVGLIVHESCGHPSEADRILGREAAQAGKSFIKPGMIGEKIGNEYATVIDDPTIPGSYGFYLCDDEGIPARPRYLYLNGVIHEHLHNRWTASLYSTESNGSARATSYSSEPIIRMANTYFKPGDYSFEELLSEIREGVYIKSYMEWNIDDERWSQRYVGLEAYYVRNGELVNLIRNPVLEITTKSFYSRIKGADKELRFYAGTCGKGEPMQGIPVWFGGPNVLLSSIKLGVAPT